MRSFSLRVICLTLGFFVCTISSNCTSKNEQVQEQVGSDSMDDSEPMKKKKKRKKRKKGKRGKKRMKNKVKKEMEAPPEVNPMEDLEDL